MQRFHFAHATWFSLPLKVLVVAMTVFALVSLYPSLASGIPEERDRALFGLVMAMGFAAMASLVIVAVNDSYVELRGDTMFVRFEGFFSFEAPLADVVAVAAVDPRPRWRYRFGLGTDFVERLSCSHGGPIVEVALARPQPARIWPRTLRVRRIWLGVREHDAFVRALSAHANVTGRRTLPAA
jgi:hypothetical protein